MTFDASNPDGSFEIGVAGNEPGHAVVGAEEMYLNAGFDGYLSKPVTIDNFEKALKNYLPDYLISDSKRVVEKQDLISLLQMTPYWHTGGERNVDKLDNSQNITFDFIINTWSK